MMTKRFYFFVGGLVLAALVGISLIVFEPHDGIQGAEPVAGDPAVIFTVPTVEDAIASNNNVTSTNAEIVRVIDGDTFVAKLDNEEAEWTVRMLGIDTPETVDPRKPVQCFGKEASDRLKELLPEGSRVLLVADSAADERDKYGRLLRNVFLSDGTDVNAAMVEDGYAHAYLSFPLNQERKNELRELEKEADFLEKGLWSPDTCGGGKSL
ncbi:MAG: thermonuclease family protein [Patescibacteria group bacterium]